jgi:hypothetical protein
VRPRDVDHLVEFVDAVGDTGRSDSPGGQDDVESTSRSEIEHGFAWRQVGHDEGVAASHRQLGR